MDRSKFRKVLKGIAIGGVWLLVLAGCEQTKSSPKDKPPASINASLPKKNLPAPGTDSAGPGSGGGGGGSRLGEIAFVSDREGGADDLFTMTPRGTSQRAVVAEPEIAAVHPVWKPGHDRLAYVQANSSENDGDVYEVDARGGETEMIADENEITEPDYSPDGTTMAYARVTSFTHDIYVRDLTTGDETNLTGDKFTDTNNEEFGPVFSPDGTELVFYAQTGGGTDEEDFEIYLYDLESDEVEQITDNVCEDIEPDWAPFDSDFEDYIVWATDDDEDGSECSDYEVVSADLGEPATVTNLTSNEFNDFEPTWSPDSSEIAFTSNRETDLEIFVLSAEHGDTVSFPARNISEHNSNDRHPDWRPEELDEPGGGGGDGDSFGRIAAVRGEFDLGDIVLIEADGSGEDVITDGEHWSAPDWKHDLTELASTDFATDGYDTFAIDPDTGEHENLTADPESFDEHDATWSPDGTMIAFTSFTGPGGAGEIFVWKVGESLGSDNPIQLTDDDDNHRHPVWAPDARELAWDTYDGTNYSVSAAFDVTDANTVIASLTDPSDDCSEMHPAFAPDDSFDLAWAQFGADCDQDGTDTEIAAFLEPSEVTVLTDNDHSDTRPTWSPDRAEIAFQSDRDGDYEIFVMDSEEGESEDDAFQLTENDVDDVAPDWEPLGVELSAAGLKAGTAEHGVSMPTQSASPTGTPTPSPSESASPTATVEGQAGGGTGTPTTRTLQLDPVLVLLGGIATVLLSGLWRRKTQHGGAWS